MSIKSNIQKRKLERLEKTNKILAARNKELADKNSDLSQKIDSLEKTILQIQDVETEYFKGLEKIKELEKQYTDSIHLANLSKEKYSKEMKGLLKQFRKEH